MALFITRQNRIYEESVAGLQQMYLFVIYLLSNLCWIFSFCVLEGVQVMWSDC